MISGLSSKGREIWQQIVSILTAANVDGGALSYVKEIIEGSREDIPNLPVIILEPLSEREENHTGPQMKRIWLKISISCWTDAYKFQKQIIGDDGFVGIMDFAAAVKNVLNEQPNLDQTGNTTMIKFPETTYHLEVGGYPNRVADITLEVDYLCQSTTR